MAFKTTQVNNLGLTSAEITTLTALLANNQVSRVLLGKLTTGDFNVTTDQAITITATKYVVRNILVTNASVSMTTAKGSVYTAASKGGTALTTSPTTTAYTALTSATAYTEPTLASLGTQTATTLYLSLTTAQGAAATADVYIFGDILP